VGNIPERSALDFFPDEIDLPSLREAAGECRGCDLYKNATQTVFGEGRDRVEVIFVGEQPGDEEDVQGRPFVGPAGRLFDRALEDAGIDRSKIYLTNTVKHFKWKPRGKRRLHEKPNAKEIGACQPWLAAEIEVIGPRILVCLGATAAQTLLGKDFRVTQMRGQWVESGLAEKVIATIHPSAVLRAPNPDAREQMYNGLVADLEIIAEELSAKSKSIGAR
jgi:uracil-DNA glycosylase